MRVLFAFVGGWGHAEPLLPLAREFAGRGHDVRFTAQAAMAAQVEGAGFACTPGGPSTIRTTASPLLAPDPAAEREVVRDVFAGFVARGRADAVLAVAGEWRPDVIVHDEVDFGAMVAAERLGIPHVSVVVIASGTFVRPELVAAPLDARRREHGLPADPDAAMLARDLVLAPVPPSFRDPSCPLPAGAVAIRPGILEAPAPVTSPGRRPLVYVTLGTIFNLESGDLFSRVIAGVRELPVDVLVTIGPYLDPADLGPQPGNVRVERFVPQAEVLPRCRAVVCHGGSGTVVGALACGVPLVLTPMGADQPDNAVRCEALGVGIGLDVMTATPDDVRRAVTGVLDDPSFRRQAAMVRDESLALPGAAHAADLVERLHP